MAGVAAKRVCSRKSPELCATPFCRNKHAAQKRFCNTCRKRRYRENNPIKYLYDNLRTHARERGKGFEITFEEFQKFCAETKYHELKGRDPDSMTIDRRDPSGPYSYDNIRPLDHYSNSIRQDNPDLSVPSPEPFDKNEPF